MCSRRIYGRPIVQPSTSARVAVHEGCTTDTVGEYDRLLCRRTPGVSRELYAEVGYLLGTSMYVPGIPPHLSEAEVSQEWLRVGRRQPSPVRLRLGENCHSAALINSTLQRLRDDSKKAHRRGGVRELMSLADMERILAASGWGVVACICVSHNWEYASSVYQAADGVQLGSGRCS